MPGLVPFRNGDAVFSTPEEMAQAIAKINETFKPLDFSIQSRDAETMHR